MRDVISKLDVIEEVLVDEGYYSSADDVVAIKAEITRLRAELASAVAAETERCARVAETWSPDGRQIAAAIRECG